MSLFVLSNVEPSALDQNAVMEVANGINERWLASKNVEQQDGPSDGKLERNLHILLPELEAKADEDKPLNLILPAYETMWRVVFLGVYEIVFRKSGTPEKLEYESALSLYLQNPIPETFFN